jgi:eukaryotic-like serine/threonine-protein kinase
MIQSSDEHDLLGTLLEGLLSEQRAGNAVPLEEYCEQYPAIAERLRNLYATVCMVEQNKPMRSPVPDDSSNVQKSGSKIGDYQILQEIGRGGMGIVYEAIQLSLGRHVALKIISQHLLNKQSAIARFRREARAAAQLHHSNIVPVFDVGQQGDLCFYAMQYIPGQSLDQVIDELIRYKRSNRDDRQLPAISESIIHTDLHKNSANPSRNTQAHASLTSRSNADDVSSRETQIDDFQRGNRDSSSSNSNSGTPFYRNVARIGLQIAEALAYAHGRGILHRDIKPSNILIDASGNAWMTDFGLAKADDSSDVNEQREQLTQSGDIVGTLRYLAPERLQGRHDHRVDIYGLGASIYELLALRPLFDAVDRVHLMTMVSQSLPTKLKKLAPRIPRDLETIVEKCIAKDPADRYRSAQSLADDLRLFLLDRPIQSRRTSWIEKTARWCRKNRTTTALLAMVSTLVVVLATGFLINKTLERQRDEALDLYKRTAAAENQSRIRSLLNVVATYRLTLAPDLEKHRRKLEAIDASSLTSELRSELRNELAACWTRADWFPSNVYRANGKAAALDRLHSWLAQSLPDGTVTIERVGEEGATSDSPNLGFVATSLKFSLKGKYIVAADANSHFQIVRRENGSTVHQGPQVVLGCEVCDATDMAAYWHRDNRVSIESTSIESPAKLILTLSTRGPVSCCSINPEGTCIAYSELGRVTIASVPTGKILSRWPCDRPTRLSWSQDGQWLASTDGNNRIHIWDVKNNERVSVLDEQQAVIAGLDWDPSSQYLAMQTWDGTVQVSNVWSRRTLVRSKASLSQIEFSADGKYVGWNFTNSQLTKMQWRSGLATELPINSRLQNSKPVASAVHPSKNLLAVALTEELILFDLETNRRLGSIPVNRPIAIDFSKTGDTLVVLGNTTVQRWPLLASSSDETALRSTVIGPPQLVTTPQITSGFLLLDSNRAIVTTLDGNLSEMDTLTGQITRTIGPSLGFSVVRIGNENLCSLYQWNSTFFELWDFQQAKRIERISALGGTLTFADPEVHTLFTTNTKGVELWNIPSMERSGEIQADIAVIGAQITFSPNRNEMAIQLAPQYVSLLDRDSHHSLLQLESPFTFGYNSLRYSKTSDFLIGISADSQGVRVWNLQQLRKSLSDQGLDWIPISATNPKQQEFLDGTFAATADQADATWDIDLGELAESKARWTAMLLRESLNRLAMSPDDARVLNNAAWQMLFQPAENRDLDRAEELARQSLLKSPNDPVSRNTLALALLRGDKLDEAESLLLQNLEASTPDQLTYDLVMLAVVYQARGQMESAQLYRTWANQNRYRYPPATIAERDEVQSFFSELADSDAEQ